MSRLMYLYVVTNLVNGKKYIGIALNPKRRWVEHRCGHGSTLLYYAIKKYGCENFDHKVWCKGEESYIKLMEQLVIAALDTRSPHGYNLTLGGEGTLGWKPGEETLAKMRLRPKSMLGKKHSAETRQKIADAHRGKALATQHVELLHRAARLACRKPILINGIQYASASDAAKALGVCMVTVRRLRNNGQEIYTGFDPVANGRIQGAKSRGWKHTETARQRMSEARRGEKHNCAKRVLVQGMEFGCLKDAAAALGVNYSTFRWRFQQYGKTGNWPDGFALVNNPS